MSHEATKPRSQEGTEARRQSRNAETQKAETGEGTEGDCRLSIFDCRLVTLAAVEDANHVVMRADAVLCREESGAPLKRVKLTPANTVNSKNGTFIVDLESWKEIEAAFKSHGIALEVDVEHESERKDVLPKDRLGAVGWIEHLAFDERAGLFADVRWNEEGLARIRSDRFRYISAAGYVRKSDDRFVRLTSAGLVNDPAVGHLEKLAAKEGFDGNNLPAGQRKDTPMNELLLIGKDLGLAEADCTVEKINNKIGEVKSKATTADASSGTVKAVCKALGATETETLSETEIVARVMALKSDQSAIAVQAGELKALKTRMADRDAEELMKVHCAGKLNPNTVEEWKVFKKLAAEQPDVFIKVMAERPVLLEGGRTTPPDATGKTAGGEVSRETIIANAVKEFRGDLSIGKVTTPGAFVSLRLQEAGQARLNDEESKKIAA